MRSSILLLALVLLLAACRKPTGANWDVDAVVPVVNSSLNIKNFLSDTLFETDNTGLLYLKLNREVASLKLDSLFSLPDTTLPLTFTAPLASQVTPGQIFNFLTPSDLSFNIGNGAMLKRVDVRKCTISVNFSNTTSQPLDLIYQIPNARKDGKAFTISETIPPLPAKLQKSYDLSGYSMDLRGANGKQYNTVYQTYTMGVNVNAVPSVIGYGQGAVLELKYSDVVPQYIEGYFGQQLIDIPLDTVSFGLNKSFRAKNFMLSDATMDFKIVNELGAEFSGSLSAISAINTFENNTVKLQTTKFDVINIDRANKVGTAVYPTVRGISLNTGNSNITSFISNIPDKLTYKGSINLNPLSPQVNTFNDFAFYNTGIRILADVSIPMRFSADYFTLTSNAEINLSGVSQLNNVRSGNFVIMATNGYPFKGELQAYMLNVNGEVIDSLFVAGSNVIEAGQLSTQNIVIAPSKSKVNMPVTTAKIEHLKQCRSLKIMTRFLVPQSPPDIQILDTYEFNLNIVAEIKYNVDTGG